MTRKIEQGVAHTTPLKSIRLKCLDCCGGSVKEIRECNIEHCALRPYRFGKNPHRKGIGGNRNKLNLSK